jgi:hypothetical protein
MATAATRMVSAVSDRDAVGPRYSISDLPFLAVPWTGLGDCGTASLSDFSIRDLGLFSQPEIADISDNSQSIVSMDL